MLVDGMLRLADGILRLFDGMLRLITYAIYNFGVVVDGSIFKIIIYKFTFNLLTKYWRLIVVILVHNCVSLR